MNETLDEIKRSHANQGRTIDIQPHPDETYPENFTFTARDMVGRRFLRKGQEILCAYVEHDSENGPKAEFILDFTKNYTKTLALEADVQWGPGTIQWDHSVKNLDIMGRTLTGLPPRDTVYCVGSGPSLMHNWPELEKVNKSNSAIVGCNELLQYLPAGLLDYYMALDPRCPPWWWEPFNLGGTTAVLGPCVPPELARAPWRDVLWYRLGYRNKLTKMLANKRPGLDIMNPRFGIGPGELELAWKFKPKNVVLVGHSYDYGRVDGVIYEHINEPLTRDRWETSLRAVNPYCCSDINGKNVVTDYHILIIGMMTLACCQLLSEAGVRVINASEGGLLWSATDIDAYRDRPRFPEQRKLADVVEEMN